MVEETTGTRRTELRRKQPQEPVGGQQEQEEEKVIRKMQGQQAPRNDRSLWSRESAEEELIRHFEETAGTRKMIADLAKGSNSTELTGLDEEEEANKWNQTTAAQEPGKKVCFVKEEKEAREVQEWQEQFMERRRRAQEPRVEEEREQEKKRCEEDDDERVRVVPNMEAGSSHLHPDHRPKNRSREDGDGWAREKKNQEEDEMVSSEGESTGVRRTRPTERAKDKEEEEQENMQAKENSEDRKPRGR